MCAAFALCSRTAAARIAKTSIQKILRHVAIGTLAGIVVITTIGLGTAMVLGHVDKKVPDYRTEQNVQGAERTHSPAGEIGRWSVNTRRKS